MRITLPLRQERGLALDMFADITSKQATSFGSDTNGQLFVEFAVDLTTAETEAVVRRLSSSNFNEETIQAQAEGAMTDLRAYADTASPTNAQTVVVVKLLCRVCIRLIRLVLHRLDATT